MSKVRAYPYTPRSALSLRPGEFWSVPLTDGSYSCGRVIQVASNVPGASRVIFLAGLLDWRSRAPPSIESIAGAKCVAQGKAHIKTIKETGGSVLGMRLLELDGIGPWEFRGATGHPHGYISCGLEPLRGQVEEDSNLPILTIWGFAYIRAMAEHRFLPKSDG